jgi:hypothetical protein
MKDLKGGSTALESNSEWSLPKVLWPTVCNFGWPTHMDTKTIHMLYSIRTQQNQCKHHELSSRYKPLLQVLHQNWEHHEQSHCNANYFWINRSRIYLQTKAREPATIIDSEDSEGDLKQNQDTKHGDSDETPRHHPVPLDFLFQEKNESDLTDLILHTKEMEYHHWHVKIGHLSKTKVCQLIENGTLPRSLSMVDLSLCSSCVYGKATKMPWRAKRKSPQKTPREVKYPGECVAVN